jgi:hypothetical protein
MLFVPRDHISLPSFTDTTIKLSVRAAGAISSVSNWLHGITRCCGGTFNFKVACFQPIAKSRPSNVSSVSHVGMEGPLSKPTNMVAVKSCPQRLRHDWQRGFFEIVPRSSALKARVSGSTPAGLRYRSIYPRTLCSAHYLLESIHGPRLAPYAPFAKPPWAWIRCPPRLGKGFQGS